MAVVVDVSTMGLPDVWPEDEDRDDWEPTDRGVGLLNLGNTCYQNAIIQCLLHNKTFVALLAEQRVEENSIADHFLRLSREHQDSSRTAIGAEGIREAMAKRHPWLGDGRQHDAQEFLVLLLDQLHDQLRRSDNKRLKADEDDEATREWRRFQQLSGASVVSDIFQGQLCSQVTCLDCEGTSRAFEPFMYLCVPVPVTLETTLQVTWCPIEGLTSDHVIKIDNKYDSLRVLKDKVRDLTSAKDDDLLVAEVDTFHVKRLLDDSDDVLSVSPQLHVFQLNTTCAPAVWRQNCPICLEAFDATELFSHSSLCSSAVCVTCLSQLEHYGHQTPDGKRFPCHVCSQDVSRLDFSHSPERCQFPVPLLFRSHGRLLHRVHVLRVSAQMDASQLYSLVDSRVPWPDFTYRLQFVERDASGCCRCSWGSTCDGCEVSRDGSVSLLPSDTLCVDFPETPSDCPPTHTSLVSTAEECILDLSDCLRAFVATDSSEWFCAHCHTVKPTQKTLRVTRAPKTLIVSLKRFLFSANKSHKIKDKVRYPVHEPLDVRLLLDAGCLGNKYRLRALVLHSGATVSSGHYSAFVWDDNKWLLCNDDVVSVEEPTDTDSRAYILFYEYDGQEATIDAILSTIDSSI